MPSKQTPSDLPTATITVNAIAPFTSVDMSYSQDPLTVTGEENVAYGFSPDSPRPDLD